MPGWIKAQKEQQIFSTRDLSVAPSMQLSGQRHNTFLRSCPFQVGVAVEAMNDEGTDGQASVSKAPVRDNFSFMAC